MTNEKKLNPERKAQIDAICDQLFKAGGIAGVSVRKVLEKMTGVSSTSTINPYVAAWKAEQKKNVIDMFEQLGFSDNFKTMFFMEMQRITSVREEIHLQELAQMQSDLDLANELLSSSEQSLADSNKKLEIAEESSLKVSHDMVEMNAHHQERMANIQSELADKEAALISKKKEYSEMNERYTQLFGEVSALKNEKSNLELNLNTQSSTITSLTNKLEAYESQAHELNMQKAKLEVQNEVLSDQVNGLNTQINESRELQSTAERLLAVTTSDLNKLSIAHDTCTIQLNENQKDLEITTNKMLSAIEELNAANTKVIELESRFDKTNKELINAKKSTKKLADNNQVMRQEIDQYQLSVSNLQQELESLRLNDND
ncbi:DNA-binding protein (plasmid) [Vibrio scophthalmi]|uniref:DNA-binding protein n=1 Tax=Vibrio scophthalmi TaxID=45658 RepID=UPI003EBDFD82